MTRSRYSIVCSHLVAVVIVAAATMIRAIFDPLLQERLPFTAYLVAVVAVAHFCGFRSALVALILSAAASDYFFFAPRYSFLIDGWGQRLGFGISIVAILFVIFLMRTERRSKEEVKRQIVVTLAKQGELECEIAERKRVEAELRISDTKFQRFVDDGPFFAFLKDEAGRYLYVNKCIEKTFGRLRADLIGKTDQEVFAPELAAEYVDNDHRALAADDAVHFDETTRTPAGVLQHWSTIKFPLKDGSGRRLLGGIALETTKIRQAERRAKESEARLLLALEAGRMGHFEWDMRTDQVRFSETHAAIHGLPVATEGMSLAEHQRIVHSDDRRNMQEAIERSLRNEAPERLIYRVVRADGNVRWIEGIGRVFLDEVGKPNRVLGISADITERKRAEIALRDSEERFRQLAMHAPIGIAQSDSEGRTFFVNPKWCEIAGAAPEESMVYGWQQFLHPDDRQRLIDSWQADMAAGKTHSTAEFRFIRKDGSIRWASSTASQLHDVDGNPIGQIGVTVDVTERRMAEIALKEAEARFRVLATKAPVGIFQADLFGKNVFANERWSEITGLTAEETLDEGWKHAIHQDDLPRVEREWADCIREGRGWNDGFRVKNLDGSIRWVLAKAAAVHDSQGHITSHIGTIMDVTEHKTAEDALRTREAQLSGILDNTSAVIYLKDRDGRYLLTNRRFQDLFKHLGESAIGKTGSEYFPDDIARSFQRSDSQVWQDQSPIDFEEVAPHSDGLHTYRSVKFPVRDDSGMMVALGGISTDISDLKAAHEALKTEQELLLNLIEVQEKEKQFLCHEFHDGLIQYAFGSAMLLESCRSNPLAAENASRLDTAIANLRRGVEDGRRVIRGIRPAVLDDSGLEAAMEDLVGQFETSGMHVTCKSGRKIGRLPELIQTTVYRVVQEALNNAAKHSGTDVVRIELNKTHDDLHLEIRDFGCGFDVPAARKKGFGLLGMTERVRLLGGECRIESKVEDGTRILVRLPIPAECSTAE